MSVSFNAALSAYNNAAKMNITSSGSSAGITNSVSANSGVSFSGAVNNALEGSFGKLANAENMVSKALIKQADITDVVTAVTNAEIALKTIVEVRDKLIAAFHEINQMPI